MSKKTIVLSPAAAHLRDEILRIVDSDKDLDPAEMFDALLSALATTIRVKAKFVTRGPMRPSELARIIAESLVETVELDEGRRRAKRH